MGNKTFHLNKNYLNKHTLHGGILGSGAQNWEIFDYGKNFVCLSLFLPDGHMGFPGNLNVYQYITIQKKVFWMSGFLQLLTKPLHVAS